MRTDRHIRQSPKLPAQKRRDQLLKAAQALFVRKGYRATTTEAIARRAGLTKGALYFHFKNKEDILCELLRRALGQFADAFAAPGSKRLSPGDVLRLLNAIDAHRSMPRTRHNLDLRAEVLKLPHLRTHVNRVHREAVDIVAARLDPQYGRTKRQRRELAVLIFSLYDGLTLLHLMTPELVNIERQIALCESLIGRRRKT
ncbi:MAG: TetR/AcrR family transcriptional regulator [Candidatus Zixiibacteriota bacterium]